MEKVPAHWWLFGIGGMGDDTPIESATLYVSEGVLDTYKSTYPWSSFGTILPWTEELEVSVDDTPELDIALKTNNGNVVVFGLADGTPVSCYTVDGRMIGRASADGDTASFAADPNSIVIVKAGKTTFKVYVNVSPLYIIEQAPFSHAERSLFYYSSLVLRWGCAFIAPILDKSGLGSCERFWLATRR